MLFLFQLPLAAKVISKLRKMNLLIILIIAIETFNAKRIFKTEKYCVGESSNICSVFIELVNQNRKKNA